MLGATISATSSSFLRMCKRKSPDRKTLMLARLTMVSSFVVMVTRPQLTTMNSARRTNLLLHATSICQLRFASLRLVLRTAMINYSSRERILTNLRSPTMPSAVKMLTTLQRKTLSKSTPRLSSSRMTTSPESLTNSARWTSMYATSSTVEAVSSVSGPVTSRKSARASTASRMLALALPSADTEELSEV